MANITLVVPWFFGLFKEIALLDKYRLGSLYFVSLNGSLSIKKKHIKADTSLGSIAGVNIDVEKLDQDSRFYWLYQRSTVQNPKPKPKGFWANIGSDYRSGWDEYTVLANIEIQKDGSAEVWVYGEKHFEEIKTLFENLKSVGDNKITLELRQTNEVKGKS